ncbi:acyl-CoA-binding domain-containing protein 1-like [Chenopodium quinoa]|uniref:acyl-CoA-binding domain-containing protein 1-like n=1 Tax=Chenopodium quinoa TaxID=63459 RepID=UPI000B78406D|nr:acyl-CoA-binding domain-containing protein 1-like [Chenopodium quinoa]
MGGEWQQLLQSVIIGLIFSFLFAKLISFVTAFRDENLSISRAPDADVDADADAVAAAAPAPSNARHVRKASVQSEPDSTVSEGELSEIASRVSDDNASVLAEKGSVTAGDAFLDDVDSDDDDWEGVESTELDEAFSAATAFVAASAADKIMAQKVGNDAQLQLYGLYKIATEGPCSAPPPPAFKLTARAKWNAWQKMGAMPPEDAMQKYVDIVTELFPSWASGGAEKTKNGDAEEHSSDPKGPMGPVFSSFIHEEDSGVEMKMDAIHAFAREGDVENLLRCIENGISPNSKDSEGRTPLHWAVDRGHLPVIDLLYSKDADVNAKDNEGQTALHYAVVCDREAIAEYLVKHNADVDIKDNDSASPNELCEKNWPWMRETDKVVE